MLRYRLILGPIFILATIFISWADERLTSVPLPGFLAPFFPTSDTFPPGAALFPTLALLVILGALELAAIFRANNITASRWITCSAAFIGLATSTTVPNSYGSDIAIPIAATGSILILVLALVYYSRHHTVEGVVAAAGGALFSYVYLGLMFGFLLDIRAHHSMWIVLGVVLITKSCDTAAYFTGRAIGRHKLIPWLSPGKTWEGLGGGLVFSTLVGFAAAYLSRQTTTPITPFQGALGGFILGLVAQAGDLAASLLKRDAGMKDSSHALPGFGGIIDVIDSPLLAAPFGFWLLRAFTKT